MILLQEAQSKIGDRKEAHEVLVRNGFLMPPLKDAICTEYFLAGVLTQQYWCLKSINQKNFKQCPVKLTKAELAGFLGRAMYNAKNSFPLTEFQDRQQGIKAFKKTAELIMKKLPDKNWMYLLLSTVEPNHQIFARTYQRPIVQNPFKAAPVMVPNLNGIFNDMPLSRRTNKRFCFISKKQKS